MFQCWCLHGLPSEKLWGNQPLDTACEGSRRSQEAWSNLSGFGCTDSPRATEREWCWESLTNGVLTFSYCGERKANVLSSVLGEIIFSWKKSMWAFDYLILSSAWALVPVSSGAAAAATPGSGQDACWGFPEASVLSQVSQPSKAEVEWGSLLSLSGSLQVKS